MAIAVLGIDLGKNSCSVAGLDGTGRVVLRRRLTRESVVRLAGTLPACVVAMEACCGAHHLGRVLREQGHEVRLMPPEYVQPYVKAQKNDERDAEAIAEAATRPTMRFVELKSEAQLDAQILHRARSRLVGQRTALINQLRAVLLERGLRRSQRDGARRGDRHGRDLPPGARSRRLAGPRAPSGDDRRQAPASRHHEARQHLPAHTPDPWRPSRLAVALGQPESDGRVVARSHRTSPQEQGHRRARRQARPDRLGSPAFRRDLCEGGTAGGGLNEIDRCGSPAAAVSDVCGRWTRDGLTVDPAPWNPGLKYGARRRKSYEGQGCAELHLGRGTTPRPDTLAQTGQITRKSCLRTGRAIRF
jgi:hypothetical protein